MHLSLKASTPDILQQTIPLRQSVQGIIALAHRSYETAKCVNLVLARKSAVLINLCYGDLNRCVVLGLDNAVGCAALAGDVAVINYQFRTPFASQLQSKGTYRSTSSPLSFSIFAVFLDCGFGVGRCLRRLEWFCVKFEVVDVKINSVCRKVLASAVANEEFCHHLIWRSFRSPT
jgi:hypothetical protein